MPVVYSSNDIYFVTDTGVGLQVSLVINFNLPSQPKNYIHRVASNLRERPGVTINFVTKDDEPLLKDVQEFYNIVIEDLPENVADLI